MTRSSTHRAAQLAASALVFVVLALPALMIWWAGSNGSLGDLSEIELLGAGLVVAVGASALAGALMGRALEIADHEPAVGVRDPWAALFVGTIVLSIAVTLIPAVGLLVLLPDENTALGERVHLLAGIWVGGSILAATLAWWLARLVLVRGR